MALLLDEKIAALGRALDAADVPHAFGGALALAYYATPRGTHDIDLNVFLPAHEAGRVLAALGSLGVAPPSAAERARLAREDQARLWWEHTPIDLFFSYDPLHASCLARCQRKPFGDGTQIAVLAAEDLVVFKVIFDRDKDWSDVRELLFAQADRFDAAYTLDWLGRILEPGDPRGLRYRQLLERPDA